MSDANEQAMAKLLADAEIRRTLARYCHTIDDGDFEGLAQCFAQDAELDAFGRTRNGRDAVIALFSKAMPPESRGKHLTCNSVVDGPQQGEDGVLRAAVLSDFSFIGPDGSTKTGRYADEFVHDDGAWRIGKRAIIFTGG